MRLWFFFIITILFAAVIGCSSTGIATIPVIPPGKPMVAVQSGSNTVLWGLWEIHINPATLKVDIVPMRTAEWTVNIVKFMQPPGGPINSLKVDVVDATQYFSNGRLVADVTLTHPFPGLYEYTGMDVRGVFISSGHDTLAQDSSLKITDRGGSDPYLANADGYTRWMNPVEFPADGSFMTYKPGALGSGSGFNATLNAYKYFTDGLGATDGLYEFFKKPSNLEKRGQFRPSVSNKRRYDLRFNIGSNNKPGLVYQYAVLASWAEPVNLNPNDLPGSFPPEANCGEAFAVKVFDESTLYYTTGEAGGNIKLSVEIFDWAPFLAGTGTVLDQINRIILESPQNIMPAQTIVYNSTAIAAIAEPGTTAASSVVTIDITGCTPKGINGQELLITVEHSGSVGYGNNGLGTNYPGGTLATYFLHNLSVGSTIPQADLPVILSINPDQGMVNTYISKVQITGKNLNSVTQIRLVGQFEEIAALNFQILDPQHIQCDLNLHTLTLGFYDIIADYPGSGQAILKNGFKVY